MYAKLSHRLIAGIAAASAAIFITASCASAAGMNFSGKTVTIVVPFKEGGGADVYARLFHWPLAQ
jgi:tripartite-type tricarboxylate transporter receptor subunit TctC